MKCLSIRQPWAGLFMDGRRSIEIRSWAPKNHSGPTLIHASRAVVKAACEQFGIEPKETGCILGTVNYIGAIKASPERWEAFRDRHLETGSMPEGKRLKMWFLVKPK